MKPKSTAILGLSLGIVMLLLWLRPLGMTLRQSAVFAALLVVVIWWVSAAVERTVASVALLLVFLLVAKAPAGLVFTFPLSKNFWMIAISFLFSQGIINSSLAQRLLEPLLHRYATSPIRMVLSMLACGFLLSLMIPQSISRVIILASIFAGYFDRIKLAPQLRSTLMLGLFVTAIFGGLLFIRADMVLNYGLLSVSGLSLSEADWIRYIAPPTLAFLCLAVCLYLWVFRKVLATYHIDAVSSEAYVPLSRVEKRNLVVILAVVLLWSAEPLHHISGTLVVAAGTLAMFPLKLLHLPDLRAINLKLLVFLTAAFSIGGIMKFSGIAELLFSRCAVLFPTTFSPLYAAIIMLVTMAMHMFLGSNVTTLSVVVPGLLSISAGVAPPEVIAFLIYLAVAGHFLLPFHHVTLAVGEGAGYYSDRQVLRFGLPLTLVVLVGGIVFYLGWWHIIGVL